MGTASPNSRSQHKCTRSHNNLMSCGNSLLLGFQLQFPEAQPRHLDERAPSASGAGKAALTTKPSRLIFPQLKAGTCCKTQIRHFPMTMLQLVSWPDSKSRLNHDACRNSPVIIGWRCKPGHRRSHWDIAAGRATEQDGQVGYRQYRTRRRSTSANRPHTPRPFGALQMEVGSAEEQLHARHRPGDASGLNVNSDTR